MKRRFFLIALLLPTGCSSGPTGHGPNSHASHHQQTAHHDFSDASRWSKMFDDPARDEWQKPEEVIRLLEAKSGMRVVDLGAGTGYFARRLSTAVGTEGELIALDPEPNMVEFMRARFEKEGINNATARVCPLDATGLEPNSVDRVLIVDTWHHIANRKDYARHLATLLRDNGLVLVVDFTLDTPRGPPKFHRIPPEVVAAELSAGGLEASIVDEVLPDQYAVIARLK